MPSYDFSTLSPPDFEALARDILQAELAVRLQSFTTGRDKGIDLRHAPVDGQDWIVQCKHYARTPFSTLLSQLREKELPKVQVLRPSRYILVTSLGLTPQNIDDIYALFSPYCRSKDDIFGRDDLNGILAAHPDIEQSNFKLWLTSEAVLQRVLHNGVFVQSALTADEIRRKLSLYVRTRSVGEVRSQLEKDHVCIISGIPGVGKSTLAEITIVDYLMNGWELVSIRQNIREGHDAMRRDHNARQILYYDDFLGQISTGEKLGKNEDKAILELISSVQSLSAKRFILTTREYILAQAKVEHEVLSRSSIDIYKYVVRCDAYSNHDKARILLNHIYFNDVEQEHIEALIASHTYRRIVGHRNYSPRIIEWMTTYSRIAKCAVSDYSEMFISSLDNPADLWKHAFEHQISDASRHLLVALATCGREVVIDNLRVAFSSYHYKQGSVYGFKTKPSDCANALNELEGNFLRFQRYSSDTTVQFHNASILDFVANRLASNMDEAKDVLSTTVYFDQVRRLAGLLTVGEWNADRIKDANETPTHVRELGEAFAKAFERTLDTESISLLTGRYDDHDVCVTPAQSRAYRISVALRAASYLKSSSFDQFVVRSIDCFVGDLYGSQPSLEGLVSLLEEVVTQKFASDSERQQWLALSKTYIVGSSPETFAQWGAAVNWIVGNKGLLSDDEVTNFRQKTGSALSILVPRMMEYEADRGELDRLGQKIEDIGQALGLDVNAERQIICERQRALDKEPPEKPRFEFYPTPHDEYISDEAIDAMFDSLIGR